MKELISIIDELHAPKNKTNTFGKFNYRDAAGILEAAKPLLKKYNCLLTVDTDVVLIGDRYYIKAVAEITNGENEAVNATALAREQESKSGMDAAQLTGACISYAKKYALCNLFCIDDSTDDPDTDDSTKKQQDTTKQQGQQKAPNAPSNGTKPQAQATAPTKQEDAPKKQISELVKLNGNEPDEFVLALTMMRDADSTAKLVEVWNKYSKAYGSDPRFVEFKNIRKKELAK